MVEVIKEIRLKKEGCGPMCVIGTNCYGSQLSHIKALSDQAKQEFPSLSDDDIKIVHFGGRYYARTFGIEFTPPIAGDSAPEGWRVINELEYLL